MAKFYVCKHCGNLVGMIHASGAQMICCGDPMTELIANTSDGAMEKHVPEVTVDNGQVKVQVGSVEHPMLEEHHIAWIYLETEHGGQRKGLHPGDAPKAEFCLTDGDIPVAVYEYCNLHGLWKKEL